MIFHDHGSRYLGQDVQRRLDAREGLPREDRHDGARSGRLGRVGRAAARSKRTQPVEDAVRLMSEHDFSQISITRDERLVGSLNETHLYDELVRDPDIKSAAGRVDHAAGVSVRRHLDAGGAAVDDDHAGRIRRCWCATSRPTRRSSSRGRTSSGCCARQRLTQLGAQNRRKPAEILHGTRSAGQPADGAGVLSLTGWSQRQQVVQSSVNARSNAWSS